MQARRRIEHEVPGGQLDVVRAVGVLDDQFAAVIFLGLRQEQRRREVGANPQARELVATHGIVDMDAEMVAAVRDVAIEQRRKNPQRDGGREKPRIGRQRLDNPVTEFARHLAVGRQLLVALHQRRLRAGGRASVLPRAIIHDAAEIRHIRLAQHCGDADQHRLGQYLADSTR